MVPISQLQPKSLFCLPFFLFFLVITSTRLLLNRFSSLRITFPHISDDCINNTLVNSDLNIPILFLRWHFFSYSFIINLIPMTLSPEFYSDFLRLPAVHNNFLVQTCAIWSLLALFPKNFSKRLNWFIFHLSCKKLRFFY